MTESLTPPPWLNAPPVPEYPYEETHDLRTGPDLHPALLGLLPFVGVWRGRGRGGYPTIERDFDYAQEVRFSHDGRPFLAYESRAWLIEDDGTPIRPAGREVGWWRPVQRDGKGTDEVEVLLTDPHTMLGLSDAGAHASQLCDSGFSTHLLSRWVRERRALTLEDAVRKLTSEPAEIFGITDRGLLAPGRAADVVVFDPATVACSDLRRVHDQPAGADRLVADAIGIDAVVVNGVTIRRDGADVVDPTGPLPGRLLRNGSA